MAYTYASYTASNGVVLNTIKTSPNNIYIKYIGAVPVTGQSTTGVNGGYFDPDTGNLLQIAVNNDVAVNGSGYGGGSANLGSVPRGTLVWDTTESQFSVQVKQTKDQLAVVKRTAYWAQGGISMSLNSDSTWAAQADSENMQNRTGSTERTGLVYNNTNNIWLVVTLTKCTAAAFRTAIKEKVGSGTLVNGIFLDGGSSTQIKSAEKTDGASSRPVYQMVALRS
ncbi:phosphodiester glycosidase family protein [Paenibacillus sp. FSL E2-0178]|uniref:phosphodiester glycosidase family protein n=1 Tax=Paenibacillus sp. FSL E2-0178 TaxID=2921361 RepID=UPI003158B23D